MKNNFFPSNLRYLRKRKNKTQDELSEDIGKKRGIVSYYERGESEPPLGILLKFCEFFNVSLSQLISEDLTQENNLNLTHSDNLIQKKQVLSEESDTYHSLNNTLKELLSAKDALIKSKESEIETLKEFTTSLKIRIKELEERLKNLQIEEND